MRTAGEWWRDGEPAGADDDGDRQVRLGDDLAVRLRLVSLLGLRVLPQLGSS